MAKQTCICEGCGYKVKSKLWPWRGFFCDECQKKRDRAESARIDHLNHHAYLSHLANRMMR